jgi:hypothetical protein
MACGIARRAAGHIPPGAMHFAPGPPPVAPGGGVTILYHPATRTLSISRADGAVDSEDSERAASRATVTAAVGSGSDGRWEFPSNDGSREAAASSHELELAPGEGLSLHVFVDGNLVEVVANGRASLAVIVGASPLAHGSVRVVGPSNANLEGWALGKIWGHSRF